MAAEQAPLKKVCIDDEDNYFSEKVEEMVCFLLEESKRESNPYGGKAVIENAMYIPGIIGSEGKEEKFTIRDMIRRAALVKIWERIFSSSQKEKIAREIFQIPEYTNTLPHSLYYKHINVSFHVTAEAIFDDLVVKAVPYHMESHVYLASGTNIGGLSVCADGLHLRATDVEFMDCMFQFSITYAKDCTFDRCAFFGMASVPRTCIGCKFTRCTGLTLDEIRYLEAKKEE